MRNESETLEKTGVCARANCSNPVEEPYISGSSTRSPELQALFVRMAGQALYCPECQAAAEAWEREKEIRDRVRQIADLQLVPRDFRDRRLALSNPVFEKQNVEAWRRARARWPLEVTIRTLAFEGPPGVGKSWAAGCILNAQLERGLSVASISTGDVVRLQDSKQFRTVDWLHLEDFDKVEWCNKYCLRLFHLLDGVATRNGRIILCLNGTLEDVFEAQKLAYRGKWQTVRALFDRLAPCHREPMGGENLRKVVNA